MRNQQQEFPKEIIILGASRRLINNGDGTFTVYHDYTKTNFTSSKAAHKFASIGRIKGRWIKWKGSYFYLKNKRAFNKLDSNPK